MADVRALLAAERQSRRITHPHLIYSKSGALTCNICNLNIKSEQLWPGHLKSLNHRKNVQRTSEDAAATNTMSRPTKRKIDNVDDDEDRTREHEVDSRKKPRSGSQTPQETMDTPRSMPAPQKETVDTPSEPTVTVAVTAAAVQPVAPTEVDERPIQPQRTESKDVDEDEWAAFERDVAGLTEPKYASATIEAAPVTTADLAELQKTNGVQEREDEAEAEKEEESRRLEEEFEVMEEMEERVKRLRERREALRARDSTRLSAINEVSLKENDTDKAQVQDKDEEADKSNGDDDDDGSSTGSQVDDWYG